MKLKFCYDTIKQSIHYIRRNFDDKYGGVPMADGNKTDQIPDELENLSPEELQERIQEEKKNAKRSLRFAFTALLAIVAVCIAWFVANNRVTMTGTQISAENTVPFELASIGSRQKVEIDKLKENNKNIQNIQQIFTFRGKKVEKTVIYI